MKRFGAIFEAIKLIDTHTITQFSRLYLNMFEIIHIPGIAYFFGRIVRAHLYILVPAYPCGVDVANTTLNLQTFLWHDLSHQTSFSLQWIVYNYIKSEILYTASSAAPPAGYVWCVIFGHVGHVFGYLCFKWYSLHVMWIEQCKLIPSLFHLRSCPNISPFAQ